MEKNVIAIGAYCPNDEREQVLSNLISSIKDNKPELDIVIYSRTHLSQKITSQVNHVVINNHNPLLSDYGNKSIQFFKFRGQKHSSSFYNKRDNTHLPALFNLLDSIDYCKNLGYSKGFYIEYDVVVKDYSIFDETNRLFNEGFNFICGLNESNYVGKRAFPFFGVNLLVDLYKTTEEEEIARLRSNQSTVTSEHHGYKTFSQFYKDKFSTLSIKNRAECIIDSCPIYNDIWNWFTIDDSKNKLVSSVYNPSNSPLTNDAIFKVNGEIVFTDTSEIWIHHCNIQEYDISLEEINTLEIITKGESKIINLEPIEEKNKFKIYNFTQYENV